MELIFLVLLTAISPSHGYYNVYSQEYNTEGNFESGTWNPYICMIEVIGGNTIIEDNVLRPKLGFKHCSSDVSLINSVWYSNNPFHRGQDISGNRIQYIQINLTFTVKHLLDQISFRQTVNARIAETRAKIAEDKRKAIEDRRNHEERVQKELEEKRLNRKKEQDLNFLKQKSIELYNDSVINPVKTDLRKVYLFEDDEGLAPVSNLKVPVIPPM